MRLSDVPKHCHRCGDPLPAWTMSKFNNDVICMPCKKDEREAPNYKRADDAECDAVRAGNYNFPGIGLASEDRAFLAERRRQRSAAQEVKP